MRKPKEYYVKVRQRGGIIQIAIPNEKATDALLDALDRIADFAVAELVTKPGEARTDAARALARAAVEDGGER